MEKKFYLGLDVGGTNLCAGVVDSDCNIISTGCDVPPGIPVKNIEAFYDALNR